MFIPNLQIFKFTKKKKKKIEIKKAIKLKKLK